MSQTLFLFVAMAVVALTTALPTNSLTKIKNALVQKSAVSTHKAGVAAAMKYSEWTDDNVDLRKHGPEVSLDHKNNPYSSSFIQSGVEAPPTAEKFGKTLFRKDGIAWLSNTTPGNPLMVTALIEELYVANPAGSSPSTDYEASLRAIINDHNIPEPLGRKMIEALAAQSAGDLPYYVSHAASHGIRVYDLGKRFFPTIYPDGSPDTTEMLGKWKLDDGSPVTYAKLQAAIDMCDLLHDIGYAGTPPILNDQKYIHAESGARMLKAFMDDELKAYFGADLTADIYEAIRTHNYDTHAWEKVQEMQPQSGEAYLIAKGRVVDTPANRPVAAISTPTAPVTIFDGSELTRDFRPAFTGKGVGNHPLVYISRLADNLDALHNRLTVFQRSSAFMKVLHDMYVGTLGNPTRSPSRPADKSPDTPAGNTIAAMAAIGLDVDLSKYSAFSFLHFYSNWIIESVSMAAGDSGLMLTVNLFQAPSDDAAGAAMTGANVLPYAAYYQINRLADAADSLRDANGNTLTDTMNVVIRNTGQTDVSAPLRAFSASMIKKVSPSAAQEQLWVQHNTLYKGYQEWMAVKDASKGCSADESCAGEVGKSFGAWMDNQP